MSSSALRKYGFLVLLVVSVTVKVVLTGLNEQKDFSLEQGLGPLAVQNGFVLAGSASRDVIYQSLRLQAGFCDATIAAVAPQGWERDAIRRGAGASDDVFFVYKGQRFRDQPVWRTWVDYYLTRAARVIGVQGPLRPVLAVIAGPACRGRLNWLTSAE